MCKPRFIGGGDYAFVHDVSYLAVYDNRDTFVAVFHSLIFLCTPIYLVYFIFEDNNSHSGTVCHSDFVYFII